MNRITNLLVFLLWISFILPATAIKHAQAHPNPCEGGSCDPATPPPLTPTHGGPMANTTSEVESNSPVNTR